MGVAPENVSADSFKTLRRRVVVDAGLAIFIAVHQLPGAFLSEPPAVAGG